MAKYAIGIDIGATNIKGVVVASDGRILFQKGTATKSGRKRAEILADIVFIVDDLKNKTRLKNLELAGAGIGIPGKIKKGKTIFGGGTLKQFIGADLKNLIQKKTGLKTEIENDSVCFALAESHFGIGKKYSRIAGVIWGTGIGSGIINKNNRQRLSVEMGHFVVESNATNEPKDACGKRGCVENLSSGKNIVRRYYAKGGKIKNAGVKEIYLSREKVAKEVLEEAYRYLGMGISILIEKIKPEIVVIGGGVSNLPETAHKKLRKYVREYLPRNLEKTKIVKSKLGNFAGALGAAMLILKR